MNLGETLYVTDPKEWRRWLSKNHKDKEEIWLIYYKKSSGKPTISYEDAVRQALCFGWIDSTEKSIDEEKFAGRFSPRKPKSNLSESNVKRVKELTESGEMTEAVLKAIAHVFKDEKG